MSYKSKSNQIGLAEQTKYKTRHKHAQDHLMSTHITSHSINSTDIYYRFASTLEAILAHRILSVKKQAFSLVSTGLTKNMQIPPVQKSNNQLMQIQKSIPPQMFMFLNHCATLIQSKFKAYQTRKYYLMFRPILRRFKQLLLAIVSGWRVRRIMIIKNIKNKISKIRKQAGDNKNTRQIRILKRQLIEDFEYLLKKGKWMSHYQQQRKASQKQKNKCKISKIILKPPLQQSNQKSYKISNKLSLPTNSNFDLNQTKKLNNKAKSNNENQFFLLSRPSNQQVISFKRQTNTLQQQPIKATGFYNVQDLPLKIDNQKQSRSKNNINKINAQVKSKKAANQNAIIEAQAKQQIRKNAVKICLQINEKLQNQRIQQKSKSEHQQSKANQHDKSQMQIHLPVQQIQCPQLDQNRNIQNRTMKFQINKMLSRNLSSQYLRTNSINKGDAQPANKCDQIQAKKLMFQTQKVGKYQRKGIKVTLCSNKNSLCIQKSNPNQETQRTPSQNRLTKIIENNINSCSNANLDNDISKTLKNSPQVKKIQKEKNSLDEILQVYNGTYTRKKNEISVKLSETNSKTKFLYSK